MSGVAIERLNPASSSSPVRVEIGVRTGPDEKRTRSVPISPSQESSGRVTIEADEINFEAYMANSTAYMNGWLDNDQLATFEVNGDVMTLTLVGDRVFELRRPK